MKKNFKKYLSYVLGVVLAMGLGLSYAYAVGANDSNAFVTTTEWEQRVAQIEASLDNVNKTINDTSMDFMMNGPRLQSGLNEGFENIGGGIGDMFFSTYYGQYRGSTWDSLGTRMPQVNTIQISDQLDGRQAIQVPEWYNGNGSSDMCLLRFRFAVKTNDPNIYLVVNWYTGEAFNSSAPYVRPYLQQFVYYDLANPYSTYSTAKTVEVTLPFSEWWPWRGDSPSTEVGRRSAYIYTGRIGQDTAYPTYLFWSTGNSNSNYNLSNPGTGYVSRTATSTHVTYRFEFPANANIIRDCNMNNYVGIWDTIPIDMKGRKFGNMWDRLSNSYSTAETDKTHRVVAKVYSPQKGCLALKTFYNGEIPILNE